MPLIFSLTSFTQLLNAIQQASWLEFSSFKPGNVGPMQSINGVTHEMYRESLTSILSFYRGWLENPSKSRTLGDLIYGAVEAMIQPLPHKNLLLGHILLYSPILIVARDLLSEGSESQLRLWNNFWQAVVNVLENSTPYDGVRLSEAISLAQAGGLKQPGGKKLTTKYDFTDPEVGKAIAADGQTLLDLFKESEPFDMISRQYCTSFEFCREKAKSWVLPHLATPFKPNEFILDLFLTILADVPDSLIFRKNSETVAKDIQEKAKNIRENGGSATDSGKKLIDRLNQEMVRSQGKLNPGTTADLTACIVFLADIFGIIPEKA